RTAPPASLLASQTPPPAAAAQPITRSGNQRAGQVAARARGDLGRLAWARARRSRTRPGGTVRRVVQRERILARLARAVDQLAAEATAAIRAEVPGFAAVWSDRVEAQVYGFAQEGIAQSIDVMRRRTMPPPGELEFVRERAALRARQLVPIS